MVRNEYGIDPPIRIDAQFWADIDVTAGNPYLRTKLLKISIVRGFRALKG